MKTKLPTSEFRWNTDTGTLEQKFKIIQHRKTENTDVGIYYCWEPVIVDNQKVYNENYDSEKHWKSLEEIFDDEELWKESLPE